MSLRGRLTYSGVRVSLWVSCELSLYPRLHPYGTSKSHGSFSKFPLDRDWLLMNRTDPQDNPPGIGSCSGAHDVFPGLDACSCSAQDHTFVATSPFWPNEEPCPSDESISFCVSDTHQQSLSFPGHLQDRVARARVNPMTIVFSNNQMPFLTSICCLDIELMAINVQLHGVPLFYRGDLLSL